MWKQGLEKEEKTVLGIGASTILLCGFSDSGSRSTQSREKKEPISTQPIGDRVLIGWKE